MTTRKLFGTLTALITLTITSVSADDSCKKEIADQEAKVAEMHNVYNTLTANKDRAKKQQLKSEIITETDKLNTMKTSCEAKPQPATVGNFYRQDGKPEVYFQYTPDHYCHVQNEAQMAAFGGFGKVEVLKELNLLGSTTGDCGWPNGFYRKNNDASVYNLSGSQPPYLPNLGRDICHVINETQMAAFGGFGKVVVIPDSSDIHRGRDAVTECTDPK